MNTPLRNLTLSEISDKIYYTTLLHNFQYFLTFFDMFVWVKIFLKCRFVNDVLHFLKNFAIYKESPDIISRGFPIKRMHRKLVVVIAIYL